MTFDLICFININFVSVLMNDFTRGDLCNVEELKINHFIPMQFRGAETLSSILPRTSNNTGS